ncbi:MAG: DUF3089 domain-containing protein [Lewinella sp.]|uniref:DUF3089 domain-containing protein n=1 Tax=Lewinella sp. TaxID=2004506 RepID=UPI003D6B9174
MKLLYLLSSTFLLFFYLTSCQVHPREPFSSAQVPTTPDYSQDRYWAALPWRQDAADKTPDGLTNQQASAKVDVFFLHPTTYTGKRGDKLWNGPVKDAKLNERTNDSPIQYQASIFNGSGRVFAPYYRQAHLHAYFTEDTLSARRAFDLAYDDVRKAFRYYLANHNQNRPIIIASHSQGTTHAIRLLKEFFDDKPLSNRLVAAYIVGIPVLSTAFTTLEPCQDSTDLNCYTAWRTYKRGYEPTQTHPAVVVTNPLTWTLEDTYAPASLNDGAVIRPFEKLRPEAADAQVHGPVLWASKPKFPGSWLMMTKNYHVGDMNIYYQNIRENVALRVAEYLAQKS